MQFAIDDLKEKLTSLSVISITKLDKSFIFETDASTEVVGAVLFQKKKNRKVRFVKFGSQ